MKTLFSFIALAVCLLAARGHAQTAMSRPFAWNQTWDVGVWTREAIGVSIGPSNSNARLTMAGFEVSRVIQRSWTEGTVRPALQYVFEATPLFLVTRPQTVYGCGFSPLGVRWNFADRGGYQPYLQWNGGGMFTPSNVPPGRTASFNFTTSIGPRRHDPHAPQSSAVSGCTSVASFKCGDRPHQSIVQYCASCHRVSLAQDRTAPLDTAISALTRRVSLRNGWSVGATLIYSSKT